MIWRAMLNEELSQKVQDVVCPEATCHFGGQAFSGELIDNG